MLHISVSYMLNAIPILKALARQNVIVAEVIGMTERLYIMETLDDLLLKVLDETMKQVFRETGTKFIYNFLENNIYSKREDIAEKPEVFSAALQRLLGSGARVIEKLILKNLYSKLRLKLEEKEGYEFSDYVKELKKRFEGRRGLTEES